MESKNIMFMFVTLFFLTFSISTTDVFSSNVCPAMFIYKPVDNAKRLENKFNITDSFGNTKTNVVNPEYIYLAPSIGTDVIIIDPNNPENVIVLERVKPEKTLNLPGGYIENLIPFKNAAWRFKQKVKTVDNSEIAIFEGKIGLPLIEQMTLNHQTTEGPFFGTFGHGDRADGHQIALVFQFIISQETASKLTTNVPKEVAAVHSCKLVQMLKANIEIIVPEDQRKTHFLNSVEAATGPCAYKLFNDNAAILYKLYAVLVKHGILNHQTGNAISSHGKEHLYQITEHEVATSMRIL